VGATLNLEVQPSEFLSVPGKPDLKVAAVTWITPEIPVNFNLKQVIAEVKQGTNTQPLEITLYAPPVLFVHGPWADASAWDKFGGDP